MRIVTNEHLVNRNRKFATRLFFFSLAVLVLGFFFANGQVFGLVSEEDINRDIYLLGMPIILIVGFITTMVSVRMTNMWVRVPRPEKAIQEGLKGISNKSALYSYFHLPARHVLVSHNGIFPMVTRFQDGEISVKDDKWRIKRGPLTQLFSIFRMDSIGNPSVEAQEAEKYIRYLLEDYDADIPVYPIIVFHDPRAKLTIENPSVPVVYSDPKREPSLKDYIRSKDKAEQLDTNEKLAEFIEDFETYTI